MTITPDTKNWTWTAERACPECGFDPASFPREQIPALLRENAEGWRAMLTETTGLDARPQPDKWSPLEYACHVRDCARIYDVRLALMLTQDDPRFENWDQDESAVTDRYNEQDPALVAADLVAAFEQIAKSFERVAGEAWGRPGRRSDGTAFTVESFAKYFVHDPIHHLWDVTGKRAG